LANGRCYIGSSQRIELRWGEHKSELRSGVHHSRHLQRCWAKYGEDRFKFEVLELVDGDPLAAEQRWLDQERPELNGTFNAVAPWRGKRLSAEHRAKISASHKGRVGPWLGKKRPDLGAKVGAALRGRTLPETTRAKMRAAWARRKALQKEN